MSERETKEKQYQFLVERESEGLESFGLMSSQVWQDDPRRLGFLLARYKFVSKMFTGFQRVAEIGCADGFGVRVVRQVVPEVVALDFDPIFIENAKRNKSSRWPVEFRVHDMLSGPVEDAFDGIYSCDVLEHIQPSDEDTFIHNAVLSLKSDGVFIAGSPSLESQTYASPPSKAGHVNCKTGQGMRETMSRHFSRVFIFSMNDEVVHTGFYPMAHYLFALCTGPKS